jgi:DNA mismatch repair protein MutL
VGKIRVLGPELVNTIAAGEVIERPASAVKELVENALDAGATQIDVEVEEGGRRRIQVCDNGSGVGADDLSLVFAPHATSKLVTTDDLFRVATFGFRGEALASLAAVARVRLASRLRDHDEGWEIVGEDGRVGEPRPCGARVGTLVEVTDLFRSVPVRRKFLRRPDVEYDHVRETIARFAVAHPAVGFTLVRDRAPDLTLPPHQTRRDRLARFHGPETVEALMEATDDAGPVRFVALLAPPRFSRLTMQSLNFTLNGRTIRDRVLARAILEAYRDVLPHGRYPQAFVFLEAPPGEVDVNVHPTKIEVRFRSVWALHDRLMAAARAKLVACDLAPVIRPERLPTADAPAPPSLAESYGPPAPAGPPLLAAGLRYFQVHRRYIIEEREDGIGIIDQHALHERFMVEELRAQFERGTVARQRLLVPSLVKCPQADQAVLEAHRDLLESLGFDFERFGADEVAVRAVPALLSEDDPGRLILDFIELARDCRESAHQGALGFATIEQTIDFIACRSAVRFGDRLSPAEIQRMLARRSDIEHAHSCAHGRPTSIKLTLEDLERFFKRKGT